MEHKSCPVFVDGKECDRPLTLVDLEGKKIARYDLATYECNLCHRTYFLLENKLNNFIRWQSDFASRPHLRFR